jgi:hypothetical protein
MISLGPRGQGMRWAVFWEEQIAMVTYFDVWICYCCVIDSQRNLEFASL